MPLLIYCPMLQENKTSKGEILILYSSPVLIRAKARNKARHSNSEKGDQKNRNRLMTQRGSETYLDCLTIKSLHIGIKLSNFHSFTIYLHVNIYVC